MGVFQLTLNRSGLPLRSPTFPRVQNIDLFETFIAPHPEAYMPCLRTLSGCGESSHSETWPEFVWWSRGRPSYLPNTGTETFIPSILRHPALNRLGSVLAGHFNKLTERYPLSEHAWNTF